MQESLILASTSRYRAGLLERLGRPFVTEAPGIAEEPLANEDPLAQAVRLARAKASAVARRHPQAWVLGSDQLAVRDGEVLGKPLEASRCETQLLAYPEDCAGRLMDPRVSPLRAGMSVAEALERLRLIKRSGLRELFVIDDEGEVVQGPAPSALRYLQVSRAPNGDLLVDRGRSVPSDQRLGV